MEESSSSVNGLGKTLSLGSAARKWRPPSTNCREKRGLNRNPGAIIRSAKPPGGPMGREGPSFRKSSTAGA
jgi:hypothetical protein